jgi:hypothetical protein
MTAHSLLHKYRRFWGTCLRNFSAYITGQTNLVQHFRRQISQYSAPPEPRTSSVARDPLRYCTHHKGYLLSIGTDLKKSSLRGSPRDSYYLERVHRISLSSVVSWKTEKVLFFMIGVDNNDKIWRKTKDTRVSVRSAVKLWTQFNSLIFLNIPWNDILDILML